MATRWYFPGAGSTPPQPVVSPTFDSEWEQTGEATRAKLIYKDKPHTSSAANRQITVPITLTEDILVRQFVSDPIRELDFSGNVSLVVRCSEDATNTNANLAVSIRIFSGDGTTSRGTLYSAFGTDTEFALGGAPETRIVNAASVTPMSAQAGDRIVVEMGVHATVPLGAGTALHRYVIDPTIADYALTTGLTSSLNPWIEFSDSPVPLRPSFQTNALRPYIFGPGNAR